MVQDTLDISPNIQEKLKVLQDKLGAENLMEALDKSLNIANFVADTVNSPDSKLIVQSDGKFTEMKGIN